MMWTLSSELNKNTIVLYYSEHGYEIASISKSNAYFLRFQMGFTNNRIVEVEEEKKNNEEEVVGEERR